jgi:ParB family chromosome partitioning protein
LKYQLTIKQPLFMEDVLEVVETNAVANTRRSDLFLIDHRNVVIEEGFNCREDYGDIEALAQSIITNGQLEPILVFKVRGEEKYVVIEGHRRRLAVNLANELGHTIMLKAIIGSANPEDRLFAQVITGNGKLPLNPIETAEVFKRLTLHGYTVEQIVARVGKSGGHVYNMLRLAEVPIKVKNAITSGEIAATTVMQLVRNTDADKLSEVIEQAISVAKSSGEKRVTNKTVSVVIKTQTPLQKLGEAHNLLGENASGEKAELLASLVYLLSDKTSTAEQVAALFK